MKKKWYLVAAAAVVVVLVVAFLAGRRTAPVVTKEVAVEVHHHHEKVELRQEIDLKEVYAQLYAQLHKEFSELKSKTKRTTVTKPDGTTTITEEEDRHLTTGKETDTKVDTKVDTDKQETTDLKKETTNTVVVYKEKETKVQVAPTWLPSFGVGYSVPSLWGRDVPNYVPGMPDGMVIQGGVGRRVGSFLGADIYIGPFGSSRGDVGVQVTGGF